MRRLKAVFGAETEEAFSQEAAVFVLGGRKLVHRLVQASAVGLPPQLYVVVDELIAPASSCHHSTRYFMTACRGVLQQAEQYMLTNGMERTGALRLLQRPSGLTRSCQQRQ